MIYRLLDDLSSYTDRSEISAYAENAVKALVGKGIIEGRRQNIKTAFVTYPCGNSRNFN